MDEITKERVKNLSPYMFRKGDVVVGRGKPKGPSMKHFARQMLASLSDEERMRFMHGLPKEVIWKMAEGNPASDLTSGGEKIQVVPIYGGASVNELINEDGTSGQVLQEHDSNEEDILSEEEN